MRILLPGYGGVRGGTRGCEGIIAWARGGVRVLLPGYEGI